MEEGRKEEPATVTPEKGSRAKEVISNLKNILGPEEFGKLFNSDLKTLEASTWISPVFGVAETANIGYDGELYSAELGNGREVVIMRHRANIPFGVMLGGIDMRPLETWAYFKDQGQPTICKRLSREVSEQQVPHEQAPDLKGLLFHLKEPSILGTLSTSESFTEVKITS